MEEWQPWVAILIGFLVMCLYVAPARIFLPRFFQLRYVLP
jgi:hypothetical protein